MREAAGKLPPEGDRTDHGARCFANGAQANVAKEESRLESAKQKTLETQGSQQRLTIGAEADAEVKKEAAKQQTIREEKEKLKLEYKMKYGVDIDADPPVVPPSQAAQFITPKTNRKRPANPTPCTTKSAKRGPRGHGYENIVTFSYTGKNVFPLSGDFTTFLQGSCDAGELYVPSGKSQPCTVNGKPSRFQKWECGCGGITLRITKDPDNDRCFFIQRAELRPDMQYHAYVDENGVERQGQRLEAKK